MQIQDNKATKIITNSYSSWIELNKKQFFNNISLIKNLIGPNKILSLVAKANAYGHGLLQIAKMAEENLDIDYIVVFKLSEATFLRKNRIKKNILVLGLIDEDLKQAIKNNIELTVFDLETANQLNLCAKKLNIKANIHIKIDTGLSRLGFLYDDIKSIKKIAQLSNLTIKGIYSHFSESDIENDEFTRLQISRFSDLLEKLKKENINIPIKHIENSSAVIRFQSNFQEFNLIRVGGAAYGIKKEFIAQNFKVDLKPIFSWKSRIISIKEIPAESYVSYARTFKTTQKLKVGVIPVGYCDGYDRRFSNNAFVLVNGKKANVLGRVCMNMIIVDLSDIQVNIADPVTLFGENPELNPEVLSKKLDTINYELLTRINSQIPRIIV
ncbi:alanine racemase [candidate division TM6 bacterium RIFCSPHIGHO2_12_FULL_32_22]|nr:MAG: alanine racemase [candidate division TM6 bacterium RIFCSPHIGHO2_12_FULL_32_22]